MRFACLPCLALLAFMPAGSAHAQTSASATATGTTTIVRPLTLSRSRNLVFGRIVRPTSGSATVTLPTGSDTVSVSGGAVKLTGITTTRARFSASGEGGQAISVSVPSSLTITRSGQADTIDVALLSSVGGSTTLGSSLGSAGARTISVGGTFPLPATQAAGSYSGTFTVSIAYE